MPLNSILLSIILFFSFGLNASLSTDYFRSSTSGNWSSASTWESSSDNNSWQAATLIPTNSAAFVTIQTGHTISIDASTTASYVDIEGTGILTFNGLAAQTFTVSGNIRIKNSTGKFITQSSGTFTNSLIINGNIINEGVFDMSRGGTTLLCNVTFAKNGNQTVTGNGATTRFNKISLDMGTTNANVLEISTAQFSAPDGFLENSSSTANRLKNGTLKLSGNFTYSGTPFSSNTFNNMIVSTAGFWLNNPNATLTAFNDSFDLTGNLRISSGTMNIGTTVGSSLRYNTGSTITIDGGNLNVISRIQAKTASTSTTTYTQSGGIVTLMTSNLNSGSVAGLDFSATGSLFTMNGGTIVLQNENGGANLDVNIKCATSITGGKIQLGNSSTLNIPDGFWVQSDSNLPAISLFSIAVSGSYPSLKLTKNSAYVGTIEIGSFCTLDASKDGGTTNYDVSLSGDFVNNGSFIHRSKSITFNGTSEQKITGNSTSLFNNLIVNNSSSTGIVLESPVTIAGNLTLSDGIVYSTNTNLLTLNDGATSSSGSSASFVDGPMTKNGATDFIFPVGNGTNWRRISISNLTNSDAFTATYFNYDYVDITSLNHSESNPMSSIVESGYWQLNHSGSSEASVELFWENAQNNAIPDCSLLKIANWNVGNLYWEKANNSDGLTISGSCSGTNSGTIKTTSSLSNFGLFALGQTSIISLAISLIDFQIIPKYNNLELKWITMSETNNDYFTIERTKDGIHFEEIGRVKGAGTFDGTRNYSYLDRLPYNGISYYRLSQTDFNGRKTVFDLKSIVWNTAKEYNSFVYPNPVSHQTTLKIKCKRDFENQATVLFLDFYGNLCHKTTLDLKEELEIYEVEIPDFLNAGMYQIVVDGTENLIREKVIILE